ncbi:MAG: response regulator [Eubacteriales bacterium]
MRVIIVDDERKILQDLKDTIQEYKGFEVVGAYINPLDALEDIANTKPDCAFLDIEMPGITGIDLAERLLVHNPFMDIVFITAFNHYATQAFEVNAMDYVLKPVNPARFEKTLEKLNKNREKPLTSSYKEVRVRSLGNFDVLLDGKPIKWNRSKARELLAYLLHFEGHKKPKYVICEELWPGYEPKKGLAHLQTAMCSIRKSLGDVGREYICIEYFEESYILSLGNVTWDAQEFERFYEKVKCIGDIESMKTAISLYCGDYMGSEDWSWSQLTAESLARKYEALLKRLAEQSFKNGSFLETMEIIQKLAVRQPMEVRLQILLAEAAYIVGGMSGLSQQVRLLRSIYQKAHDTDLEPEVFLYCFQKGIQI